MPRKVEKSEEAWQRELSPEQYAVCRQKGTERAFTGRYWDHHEEGMYRCSACQAELFASDTKFDSGTGWPSFSQPIESTQVETEDDLSHGMRRTEVTCASCGAHLGHVFPDGPQPSGLRYCINSVSLDFDKKK
jgi:peptide-methionine (R)-S-oxide reductase